MSAKLTSDELVAAVRRAMAGPNTNSLGLDDPSVLQHLNFALLQNVLPELLKTREEYGVRSVRVPVVTNQARYRIPQRAFMLKLRKIVWVDGAGTEHPLDQLDPGEVVGLSMTGDTSGYYIEGTDVILVPTPPGGNIQFSFYFRPGDLILSTNARQVTTVNLVTKTLTFTGTVFPTSWTTSLLFDVHSDRSGAEPKVWEAAVSSLIWPNAVFTNAIDGSIYGTKAVEVGDWMVLTEEAVIPGIPKELHGILVDAAALRIVKALGDQPNLRSQATLLREDLGGMVEQIETRNEDKPLRVKGRRGILYAGRRWF